MYRTVMQDGSSPRPEPPRCSLDQQRERIIADPDSWALVLDIDGTLLDMAATPDAVRVPPGLVETLAQLKRMLRGAVGLLTGRRVADTDLFFAPLKLVAIGVHGAEARIEPRGTVAALSDPVPIALARDVRAVAREIPGVLVEDKGAGLAVHYRHAPEMREKLEQALTQIVVEWQAFTIRPGRMVLEIAPKAHSKGTGLAHLMALPSFQGRRPVMIGDDLGDEPALQAAPRLGGIGLRVAGEHYGVHEAEFESPARVRSWLAQLHAGGQQAARRTP